MPVEYRKGNFLLQTEIKLLGHGCNCWGWMGSGVAGQMATRFPTMFEEYRRMCKAGEFTPGTSWVWNNPDPTQHSVANLATQQEPGANAKLECIRDSLESVLKTSPPDLALPRIGAGIGGLKWEDVKTVIEDVSSKYPLTRIVVYEL